MTPKYMTLNELEWLYGHFTLDFHYSVADLGFGKGRCPIHQKGAPEEAKPPICAPGGVSGGLPQKI